MWRIIVGFLAALLLVEPAFSKTMLTLPSVSFTFSSDPTTGVLPSYNDLHTNWQMAGLQSVGGIPNRTTQCGATITPSGGDDTSAIQVAINSCPTGEVVQLGAGTFHITQAGSIQLNKGITLRGTGNCTNSATPYCQTVLVAPDGLLQNNGSKTCGTSASNTESCSGQPVIVMSPAPSSGGGTFSMWSSAWSGCSRNTWLATSGCSGTVATLAADAAQGQSTVQVNTTPPFSVGMWVLIDEASGASYQTDPVTGSTGAKTVWAASDAFSPSGGPATGRVVWAKHNPSCCNDDFSSTQYPYQGSSFGCGWSMCDRPTNEIHLIKSIGAGPCPGANCTLTFDSPLTVAYRLSGNHNAQVYYPTNGSTSAYMPFVTYAGVENLTVQRGNESNILMLMCAYCWVKNVESTEWAAGAVEVQASARDQIDKVFGWYCWNDTNNGNEYPIDFMFGSTEIYLVNSITRFGGKSMTARAGGAGSVVAYNYLDDQFYASDSGIGDWLLDASANGSHYAGSHGILFEGNWASNAANDHQHGNNVYHVYFRNNIAGFRSPFINPTTGLAVNDFTGTSDHTGDNGPLRAGAPSAYAYWEAFVGNVLGWAGYSTAANNWVYQRSSGSGIDHDIWDLGSDDPSSSYDANFNLGESSFIFRHGNYDYVTAGVTWDANTPDHTLPNSFYLQSAPAFFNAGASCAYPWPWVTPTGTSQLQTNSCGGSGNPAQARFNAGTPFVQP
jgi:hypothetical protein